MLVLTRVAGDEGVMGTTIYVDGDITIRVRHVGPRSVGLVTRIGDVASTSIVPFGKSIRFPHKQMSVYALSLSGRSSCQVRLGFEAPRNVSIMRDDAKTDGRQRAA